MAELIPHIDVNPKGDVKALVVWMHGLGDSGHGFAPIVPEFNLPDELGIRFVFPHAPVRPITVNNGVPMRGWYDIVSFDFDNRADDSGVIESAVELQALIDNELTTYNLTPDKLVIAGFSQGGVMAYHLGCRQAQPIAGILSLSAYLAMPNQLAEQASDAAKPTPIMAMHGNHDEIVPIELGRLSAETVKQAGFSLDWLEYNMQHNICPEQVEQIGTWLAQKLG
ncbi:alpha/beta hydrolase [Catenovulum maritimum]|uniref:Carboxylesterase n=1 Tax=Catenovulum maritimum TaxID=1513271 RepID=A0A0J8GUP9_9ALTE|nr:dienelactone hydrolase family protein [Catenovulum maritimum]KMT64999.1 carboxylesterase [Catenovulum maritimum]